MQHRRWGYGACVAEDMAHEMTPIVLRQEKASCYWFPPTLQTTQPPKQKKIQQALFHNSKAFKKIIDIWSSWWTTKIVFSGTPKTPTYLSVLQQSVGSTHQPFLVTSCPSICQCIEVIYWTCFCGTSNAHDGYHLSTGLFRTAPSYVSSRDIEIYLHWKKKTKN